MVCESVCDYGTESKEEEDRGMELTTMAIVVMEKPDKVVYPRTSRSQKHTGGRLFHNLKWFIDASTRNQSATHRGSILNLAKYYFQCGPVPLQFVVPMENLT